MQCHQSQLARIKWRRPFRWWWWWEERQQQILFPRTVATEVNHVSYLMDIGSADLCPICSISYCHPCKWYTHRSWTLLCKQNMLFYSSTKYLLFWLHKVFIISQTIIFLKALTSFESKSHYLSGISNQGSGLKMRASNLWLIIQWLQFSGQFQRDFSLQWASYSAFKDFVSLLTLQLIPECSLPLQTPVKWIVLIGVVLWSLKHN